MNGFTRGIIGMKFEAIICRATEFFDDNLFPSKFHLEDGGSNFLRNARKFLPLYTASCPFRRNTLTVIVEMRLNYPTN